MSQSYRGHGIEHFLISFKLNRRGRSFGAGGSIVQRLIRRVRSAGLAFGKSVCLGVIVTLLSSSPDAYAKYASIIIDADSGAVLHEANADDLNYPASLTKMMTLYLLFEALDNGQVKLDDELPVSTHAANRAPSKLGLIPGDTVAVRDLMYGIVTKSANDAAAVVAEALAGSENAFAERMTLKARKLGMKNTVFHNASGLPEREPNRTTARDLATLARALYRDFPNHYPVFATREFTYRGAVMANHNHLMNSYPGMDGIKTGYINASGFNLAASAVRNNHRLIGVVMGGQSARARDARMAELLNTGFAMDGRDKVMVAKSVQPEIADEPAPAPTGVAARAVAALSPVGRAEATPLAVPRRASASASERWSVQIGAFAKHAAAEKAAHAALGKLPSAAGKTVEVIAPGKADKEHLYRARLVSFSKREADHACSVLHRKHQTCSVVAPSTVRLASN
ncbi:MAG: D-alanyl-D-alanine carboxypeptidase [Alphaproteobacteria bacterium]|nr:D-alanyl-D-alanine carboxypeptidase [Alphaproteobacteria bacterium]